MRKLPFTGAVLLLALAAGQVNPSYAAETANEPGAWAVPASAGDAVARPLAQQTPTPSPPAATPAAQATPSAQPTATPASPQPATPAAAPPSAPRQPTAGQRGPGGSCPSTGQVVMPPDADVVLTIPNLSVDQLTLDVDQLQAHVTLDARLAQLLRLNAGVDVQTGRINLDIRGVCAEAHLVVRLNNVVAIIDRTLTTVDRNPQALQNLVGSVGQTLNNVTEPGGLGSQVVGTVGQTLDNVTQPGGLLTQTVNTLGQTVERTIDTTGNIVERTLDTTGAVLGSQVVGNATSLGVVSEATNSAGQLVRQVRDSSGAVIELTLDSAGNLVGSRVVSQANGTQP